MNSNVFQSLEKYAPKTSNHWKTRRLLLERWRRLVRWEFWPAWVVYPPVVFYALGLAIRHRGLTTFAACNPSIPAGGIIGESKSEILARIGAPEFVARFTRTHGGSSFEKIQTARDFMAQNGLSFPIVIKPDAGQRGSGVAIIRDDAQLRKYFDTPRPDSIVQEFAPGPEFGIFYFRFPDVSRGAIFSVTEKLPTCVTGDGRNTLENLILADDRAVCSARFFLRMHRDRLAWIPPGCETVQLSEMGNHCRGSVFRDGSRIITPSLEDAIDRISKTFDGFFFGRFDIRTPSVEDFKQGHNFKIIELNGATSEATHIYDSQYSFWKAQRVLRNQWRIAFEIGAANRSRGTQAPSVLELAKMMVKYRPAAEA